MPILTCTLQILSCHRCQDIWGFDLPDEPVLSAGPYLLAGQLNYASSWEWLLWWWYLWEELWFVYFDDLQLHQHLVLLSLGSTILCQPNQHCWLDRQHTVLLLPDLPHPPQASQTTLRQVNIKVDCPSLPVPEHTILFGLGVLLCRSCESNERKWM